ncbi:helix-turn-helix domain-containing protein [bacterium]|nr:helix-turn-helix domain-containing protein [bacterium]
MPSHLVKHQVVLSDDLRADLKRLTRQSPVVAARKRWTTILLFADHTHSDGRHTDEEIAAEVGLSARQLERVRKRFVRDGPGSTLTRAPRPDAGWPRSSTARPRPTWSPSAAPTRRTGTTTGRSHSSATTWPGSRS